MNSLWKSEFKPQDIETPKAIVSSQCNYLRELTRGNIIAKVADYKDTYTTGLQAFKEKLESTNIQNNLGVVAGDHFMFEFFITSVFTPNYKYRVMFFEYGISFYPVTIVMDEAIALEQELEQKRICYTQEDFIQILEVILNSKKINDVISALMILERENKTS